MFLKPYYLLNLMVDFYLPFTIYKLDNSEKVIIDKHVIKGKQLLFWYLSCCKLVVPVEFLLLHDIC